MVEGSTPLGSALPSTTWRLTTCRQAPNRITVDTELHGILGTLKARSSQWRSCDLPLRRRQRQGTRPAIDPPMAAVEARDTQCGDVDAVEARDVDIDLSGSERGRRTTWIRWRQKWCFATPVLKAHVVRSSCWGQGRANVENRSYVNQRGRSEFLRSQRALRAAGPVDLAIVRAAIGVGRARAGLGNTTRVEPEPVRSGDGASHASPEQHGTRSAASGASIGTRCERCAARPVRWHWFAVVAPIGDRSASVAVAKAGGARILIDEDCSKVPDSRMRRVRAARAFASDAGRGIEVCTARKCPHPRRRIARSIDRLRRRRTSPARR